MGEGGDVQLVREPASRSGFFPALAAKLGISRRLLERLFATEVQTALWWHISRYVCSMQERFWRPAISKLEISPIGAGFQMPATSAAYIVSTKALRRQSFDEPRPYAEKRRTHLGASPGFRSELPF